MKRTAATFAMALLMLPAMAQNKGEFIYDVNFQYNFDNREFDAGDELFTKSKTINAARLAPSVGVSFKQNKSLTHKVMAGVDVVKDMGGDMMHEATLWYELDANLANSHIKGYAGAFPRRNSVFGATDTQMEGMPGRNIPTALLSDEYRFYDSNVEGFMVTAQRRRAYYEIGLDWLGMYGSQRREQFIVFSYGKSQLSKCVSAGWAANFHHYANAIEYGGVVDDNLLSPFVELDFKDFFRNGPQALSLTFNAIGGLHQDRKRDTGLDLSYGGQVGFNIMNWNVGIRNELYYGNSLMPYWSVVSPEGTAYASDLYRGNPFYRMDEVNSGAKTMKAYDRLEAYYQPSIASFLDLRISFVAHFAQGQFQGWQQKLGLVFDLEKARNSRAVERNRRMREPSLFELFL